MIDPTESLVLCPRLGIGRRERRGVEKFRSEVRSRRSDTPVFPEVFGLNLSRETSSSTNIDKAWKQLVSALVFYNKRKRHATLAVLPKCPAITQSRHVNDAFSEAKALRVYTEMHHSKRERSEKFRRMRIGIMLPIQCKHRSKCRPRSSSLIVVVGCPEYPVP